MKIKPKFNDLPDRPGHIIRRLHQIHVALFLEECSEFNLTPVQFGVLNVLAMGDALDQGTIAKMIGVDRNTAAEVIRRLEKRKLLERPSNQNDRRTKVAKITPDGKQLVNQVRPRMVNAQERLIAPLTDQEYWQFMQLSKKMIEANDHNSRAPWKPA